MKKSFEYDLTKYDPNAPTRTEQFLTDDGTKTLTTDANNGAVLIQDSVDPDSLNPVTAAAVASAVAGASGEVPVIGDGDNGKVLKAVVDGSSKSVEWGDETVDQVFNPDSTHAQSGTAVAGVFAALPKFNIFKAKYAPGTVPPTTGGYISYWKDNSSEDNIWVFAFGSNLASAFSSDTNLLEIIEADINSSLTSMSNMFRGCTALTSVPLFDTSSVTAMQSTFEGCTALTSVPLFDTSSVTTMQSTFSGCTALTSVPLFNTSSVTNMANMCQNCTALTSVPLFDTSSVTNMGRTFSGCTALTSVPLFDTSSVTAIASMFSGCTAVESGALALYTQASTQTTPPTSHNFTFSNCGANTDPSAPIHAEMAQIPTSWGGTMA